MIMVILIGHQPEDAAAIMALFENNWLLIHTYIAIPFVLYECFPTPSTATPEL